MDPTIILSLLLLGGAGFMHARLLRRTLRNERSRLDEVRLALGGARRKADEVELARREALKDLDRQTTDLAALEKQVEEHEAKLAEIKRRPAKRYHVIDRHPPRGLPIWEVPVRARSGAPVADAVAGSWQAGRTYLVSAQTAQEAGLRCAAKFPPQAGFDIGEASPAQFLNQGGSRFHRRSAAAEADPPAYVPDVAVDAPAA
jgi:hypothetical protein